MISKDELARVRCATRREMTRNPPRFGPQPRNRRGGPKGPEHRSTNKKRGLVMRPKAPLTVVLSGIAIATVLLPGCGARHGREKTPSSQVIRGDNVLGTITRGAPTTTDETEDSYELVDIHFDFDRYDLRPRDREILTEHAKWLATNPKTRILIEGHCDERGTIDYNLALGEKRTRTVRAFLTKYGIAPRQLAIISYGKARPLVPGHDEKAWALNRRARFVKR